MITLYVTVNDLAGNQGSLFQMFNIDKPDTIDEVEEEEDNTSVRLSKNLLKVLQVAAAMSGNSTLQTVGDLSKQYDGVRLGFDISRAN